MNLEFKNKCIIGSTGFIGQNLCENINFDIKISSKNLEEIIGKDIDFVICAAPSATKWKINQDPSEDILNIKKITDILSTISCKKIVLCSSIDVFSSNFCHQNEDSIPDKKGLHNYGLNRILFEESLSSIFKEKLSIFRLSGLFGPYLKKNILFDLKNKNEMIYSIDKDSYFQWYNIKNLSLDIEKNINNKITHLVNEPILTSDILNIMNIKLEKKYNNNVCYNITTNKFASGFMNSKEEVLIDIKNYLAT
jgi:dTDP-4-dehydrorhamnose reductase